MLDVNTDVNIRCRYRHRH